jgi:biotin carboxyl carrier protein
MSARPTVFRLGDREWHVIRSNDRLEVEGHILHITSAGTGRWRIERGEGAAANVFAAYESNRSWVHVNGHVYVFEHGAEGAISRRQAAADDGLSAPMPATVRALLVADGQPVRNGDTLVMLEAMKMELPIRAPRDGVVVAIHCRQGELVQPGIPLVEVK